MIWNSDAPLELLAHLPARLTKSSLEKLQAVIDQDKYICSQNLQRDLCGEYAPFCIFCDKSLNYPCAVAYVKMKQNEGIKLEIAMADGRVDETPEVEVVEADAVVNTEVVIPVESDESPVQQQSELQEQVISEQPKKRIRIAVAKRKN